MIIAASIVSFILAFASGVFKAIMDTLSFHFYTSTFSQKGDWWDPSNSWKNKYSWAKSNKVLGWLLANPLVLITDAWHFFQFLFSISFAASFFIAGLFLPWWTFPIIYCVQRLIFHIFFTWVFVKKA